MTPTLYLVIPCYNEEKVLPITYSLFLEEVEKLIDKGLIHDNSRILFADDGSKDATWEIISNLSDENERILGISLSRNRGHQNALLAGLMEAMPFCDITVSMDCDGQDDIHVLGDMVRAYNSGSEIVYGVRSSRKKDTFFKRFTAEGFYRIMNKMGCNLIFNHADYRLVSSKVLQEFSNFKEVNLFLRGMFPMVGFNSSIVYYERDERKAGQSHYPLAKMISFAIDGITSLTTFPIRIITFIGIIVSMFSFIGIIWALVTHAMGNTVDGWASIICIVLLMSGIQLLSLGVIGEYVGKTYMETKARPRYIVKSHVGFPLVGKKSFSHKKGA